MQLYQQNWTTLAAAVPLVQPSLCMHWDIIMEVNTPWKKNKCTKPGKRILLVSNHGTNVGFWYFENRDNPDGWGSETGYELTQQQQTASGTARGDATTFLGSWWLPEVSMGQRRPPVLVPSCSLQLGAALSPYSACSLIATTLAAEQREVISTAATQLRTAQRHQLETPEVPCSKGSDNSGYQYKTVFCFPSGFL